MNVRLRRLQSDYEAVRRLAHLHENIEVEGVSGKPPDRYRLVLTVRSLREKGERIVIAKKHRLEVVYDDRNRMLSHQVVSLERGGGTGGDSDAARDLANKARSAPPPSDDELRSKWRVAKR